MRILFVGNSLTTTNDLPARLQEMARAAGDAVDAAVVAYPNYSLEDHWQRGDAARAIARGGWSVVVLQQGPSALPESRLLLVDYTRRFDAQIRAVGARTALYMVWPADRRRADFPGVIQSYAAAAAAVDGLLLPVGGAWQFAWRDDPRLPLYGDDGFHPSRVATELAAVVIYEHIFGKSAAGTPDEWSLGESHRKAILVAASRTR
jgi:hypothetical protein